MADRYQDRLFPAHDDYGHDAPRAPSRGEGDPLAELARLIGQTDPFNNFGRGSQTAAADHGDPDQYASQESADDSVAAGPPPWMQKRMAQQSAQQEFEPAPHPVLRRAAVYPDNQSSFHQAAEPDHYDHADAGRYDDALYGQVPEDQAAHGKQFSDGSYPDESYAYDGYEDAPSDRAPKRRSGLMTVVAVLALGVVGTGAAFAYRTFVGSTHSGPPPIIKADAGPNKIVPQQAGSGDAVGKLIQDRMSAANGTEQMVSREEQPVDVKTATTSGPRVVFPPLNQNANPPAVASVAPSNRPAPIQAANGTLSGDEPRKIKTLTVRGDQADIAAAIPATNPTPAPQAPAPQVQAPASAPVAVRRPPPPAAAANNANAPLSLSPQSAPDPRTHVASINSAPQQIAPSAVSTGGYVVQVSSQRNEADARASFRALQGKFPSVLGSRTPLIKRADLGPKGVYYRAMVGPLGTPEEASQLCGSLKSAGGQCVVQRN